MSVMIIFMIITVDFGGSLIKMGLVENDTVHARCVIKSYAGQPFSDWMPAFKDDLARLCTTAEIDYFTIEGMVWALPLIISPDLRYATCSFGKYEDTTQKDFCNRAEDIFQIPLLLENDARAASIGEWQAGAARGKDNVVMITLGTGLGTAVILNGTPLRGRSGMAGNLGGLSVTHLHSCGPGSRPSGCTETQIATWALKDNAKKLPGYSDSLLAKEATIDYKIVFELAAGGDNIAGNLRDNALEGWGAMALNMIQAFDPECVVFGGGIMSSKDMILPSIREYISKYAVQAGGEVEILPAALGDDAALIGAQWIWNKRNNIAV